MHITIAVTSVITSHTHTETNTLAYTRIHTHTCTHTRLIRGRELLLCYVGFVLFQKIDIIKKLPYRWHYRNSVTAACSIDGRHIHQNLSTTFKVRANAGPSQNDFLSSFIGISTFSHHMLQSGMQPAHCSSLLAPVIPHFLSHIA